MFSTFAVTPLEDGYSIVQPPAGLLRCINDRLKLYYDDGNSMNANIYATIFILASLHKDGKPVVVDFAATVPECVGDVSSIRKVYDTLPEAEFKAIVHEFVFSITREKLQEWFNVVDGSGYITQKAKDDVKND